MNNLFSTFLPRFLPSLDLVQFVQLSTGFENIKQHLYSKIPTTYTCHSAARDGHLEILKWMVRKKNHLILDGDTWENAASGGHLEVIKWLELTSRRAPPLERCLCNAAMGGHLEVLMWVKEQGCSWNTWTCAYVAWGGHLEVLKQLKEQGCPWDKETCNKAANGGHLDTLKWALWEGCPFGAIAVVDVIALLIKKFRDTTIFR